MLTNIPEGWGVITPDNLNISLAEETAPFLLDVRTKREVAAGYIEGVDAVIEVHSLVSERGMLPEDKSTPIVAYCGSGWRSAIAEAALWMMGYEDVFSLAGGRQGWQTAGYPMIQDMAYVADYYTADVMPTGDDGWSNVSVDAVSEALASDSPPFLLDVREPAELEESGYIPGAVNIPVRQVGQNIDKLPADLEAPIVVYCAKGTRGTFVTTALQMLGFADVRNLNGGFGAWADAGLEVATDAIAAPEAGEMAEVDAFVLEHVDMALANWPEGWGMVAPDALGEMMADAATAPVVIDVRNPEEWVTDGVIEGAALVPLVNLGGYVAELEAMVPDKTATIVVYCKAGHRGAIGMTVLRAAGFENVLNLSGGFDGWLAAGMPVAEAPVD
jgi:rhodanese-related sulfurtransferase